MKKLIHGASLNTICEEARCPNIAECWGRGTATFQILGDTCTRACRYCYVNSGTPSEPVDPLEPLRLAQTAKEMGLKHVVVTSVDRDDVARSRRRPLRRNDPCVATQAARARRSRCSRPTSSASRRQALALVIGARPGGLQPQHRDRAPPPRADARREGELRRGARAAPPREGARRLPRADEERDHRRPGRAQRGGRRDAARPARSTASTWSRSASTCSRARSTRQIDRWVHPDEFRWFREQGEALGFGSVFSGPLVRSSYRADEQQHAAATGRGALAY